MIRFTNRRITLHGTHEWRLLETSCASTHDSGSAKYGQPLEWEQMFSYHYERVVLACQYAESETVYTVYEELWPPRNERAPD